MSAEEFAKDFAAVKPLITAEWPEVEEEALDATDGSYDSVVDLVAEKTEHSTALVKKQLGELHQLAADDGVGKMARLKAKIKDNEKLQAMQTKITELTKYARSQMASDVKSKATEHPLVVLLVAIGLGFIVGFLARGIARGR